MPDQRSSSLKSYQQTPRSHTTNATLTGTDANRTHTNLNATGSITLQLPRATPNSAQFVNGSGLEFRFLAVNASTINVQPVSTDTIRGQAAGASYAVTGAGVGLWLVCAVPGYWDIVNSSGSSSVTEPFNVSIDTHNTAPTGVGLGPNDEFEAGSSIDTAGTRYVGATPWTWVNQGLATATIESGNLDVYIAYNPVIGAQVNGLFQPLPGSGSWTYVTKVNGNNFVGSVAYQLFGIGLYNSSTTSIIDYHNIFSTSYRTEIDIWTTPTSYGSTLFTGNPTAQFSNSNQFIPVYLRIRYDGTNIYFGYSYNGFPESFLEVYSTGLGSYNYVGITFGGQEGGAGYNSTYIWYDWFRRTA